MTLITNKGDDIIMTYENSTYHYFPYQIELLKNSIRENNSTENLIAAGLLTISSCTSFIETILFITFSAIQKDELSMPQSKLIINLLHSVENDLSKAAFADYDLISLKLMGTKLSSFTNGSNWESIKILYKLRNQTIHGKHLIVQESFMLQRPTVSKNFKSIFEYLQKKNILGQEDFRFSSLFTSNTITHFVSETIDFFISVTKEVSEKTNSQVYSGFEHLRKSFNR